MIKLLSHAEFKTLEDSLPTFTSKQQAIMAILMYCGLRVGELTRLKIKDLIEQDNKFIEIHVRAHTTKTGFGRTVPIPPPARQILKDYLQHYPHQGQPQNWPLFLFPGSAGRDYMSVHGIEQLVATLCKPLLKKHITPHYLRHTYATKILKFSNIREVQMLLGHKKLSSTEIYTHPSIQDLTKSVNKAFS